MEYKDLIVLGNGFDLSCGLASSYNDYFNNNEFFSDYKKSFCEIKTFGRKPYVTKKVYSGMFYDQTDAPVIPNVNLIQGAFAYFFNNIDDLDKDDLDSNLKEYFKGSIWINHNDKMEFFSVLTSFLSFFLAANENFWFYYLIYTNVDSDINWFDVESDIKSILSKVDKLNKKMYFIKLFEFKNDKSFDDFRPLYSGIDFDDLILLFIFRVRLNESNSGDDCFDFLFKELKLFENDFKKYLLKKLDITHSYPSNAEDKLLKLRYSEAHNDSTEYKTYLEIGEKNCTVLSFNYTNPFMMYLAYQRTCDFLEGLDRDPETFNVRNIHGALEDGTEIVFGIDSKKIGVSSPIFKFTKTYRIMNLTNSHNFGTLPSNINRIIFYGHSLSEADYSYFQSMFDYYDIYNNNIQLIFGYSEYDVNHPDFEKKNQFNRVSKLLNIYGNTFHSEKGKNLMHKLLLEGRIIFKKI